MRGSRDRKVIARRIAFLGATALTVYSAPAFAQATQSPATAPATVGQLAAQPPGAPGSPNNAPGSDSTGTTPEAQQIVVTGSRIQNGNNQPTPVTVVSAATLQATTPSSIPDALNKLPQFNSQFTPNSSTGGSNGRGYGTPGNFLNLRGLGAIRTLILQDGNRVPGTFYDTTVDTNMLPQLLIQRVEVVTGGASAVYGSDAVTGVVNFITDTKFIGIKGLVQGGLSTYGDAKAVRGGVAWGTKVGDRGHFEASVEYYRRQGIEDAGTRHFGNDIPSVVGSGSAANPYKLIYNSRQSNTSPGGLVVTGPFAGMQFLSNGSLAAFNPGTATGTANAAIGGDGGYVHNQWLVPTIRTAQAFARFDYDLTDNISAYISGRYSDNHTYQANQIYVNTYSGSTSGTPANGGSYPLWIYSGNAFLTPAEQTILTSTGTNSFAVNRFDNDLFKNLALSQDIRAGAVTAGIKGNLFGDFNWDAHYTHGWTRTEFTSIDNLNTARFYAAADAVVDPSTGKTVCRVSLTAPGAFPGCVPLNLLGQGNASQAAIDYVLGNTSWTAKNKLDDAGANLTGTLFNDWAGPVKIAVGGEYRHATLVVTTTVPDDSFDPQYLRLGPAGNSLPGSYPGSNLAWFKEVQSGATGSENIYEGDIEADIPLLRDLPLVKSLDFNGAVRHTYYTTDGDQTESSNFKANTWKLGLEWQVIDGLKFRATRSRDIRAPTLWDLYQRQVISASGVTDNLTGVAAQLNTVSGGNPNLRPEVAQNVTAGVVITPRFLPGFSLSVDYFHVKIGNAISSVSGVNPLIEQLCLSSGGTSPYCGYVVRPISYNDTSPANFPTLNYSLNQNVAHVEAEGFDLEANYQMRMFGGALNLRGLWTHQPVQKTQTIPAKGAVITNAAGTQVQPVDKVNLDIDYKYGRVGFDLLESFDSHVHQSSNPTLIFDIPDVPAYFQTDINLSYDLSVEHQITAFLNITNLFNAHGGIFQDPGYAGSIGLRYPTTSYEDVVGRDFTMGVRFKF